MKRLALAASLLMACTPPAGSAGPDQVEVVPGGIDAKAFLGDMVSKASAAGAAELEPVGAAVMNESEQLGSFIDVPDDECLLAIARAGDSIRDVDLFIYDDGGDRLTSDEAPSSRAAVLLCPPHPRRVYVAARVMSGQGMLALGVMGVPAKHADAVAKAVEVRGRPGQDTGSLQAWPGLERRVRERRAALGSAWEDVRRVAMPVDPRAHAALSLPLEAKRCVDIMVVPADDVPAIDAYVIDRHGRIVARGKPPGRDRNFVLCSALDTTLTLMVRPRLSGGLVAVVAGRSPVGSAKDIAQRQEVYGVTPLRPLARAIEQHAARLGSLDVAPPKELARGEAVVGTARALSVDLAEGCTRIDVIGGEPLGPFEASVWDDAGKLVDRSAGSEHAALFRCGKRGKARVEVVTLDRGGPFVVQGRHHAGTPVMMSEPFAAARLLSRLEALDGPVVPADATGVELISLAAEQRVERPMVAGQGCVDVVAASAERGAGLSLRVDQKAPWLRGQDVIAATRCDGQKDEPVALSARRAAKVMLLQRQRR